jgi:hypothetical protein
MPSLIEQRFLFSEPRKTIRYRDYDKLLDDISTLVLQENPESFLRITLCLAGRFNSLVVAGFTAFQKVEDRDDFGIQRVFDAAMDGGVCRTKEFATFKDVSVELLGIELLCCDFNELREEVVKRENDFSFISFTSDINKHLMPPSEFDLWLKENFVCSNFKNADWHQAQQDDHELSLPLLIRSVLDAFDTCS